MDRPERWQEGGGQYAPGIGLKGLHPDSTKEKGNHFRHLVHGKYNNVYQRLTFVIMI